MAAENSTKINNNNGSLRGVVDQYALADDFTETYSQFARPFCGVNDDMQIVFESTSSHFNCFPFDRDPYIKEAPKIGCGEIDVSMSFCSNEDSSEAPDLLNLDSYKKFKKGYKSLKDVQRRQYFSRNNREMSLRSAEKDNASPLKSLKDLQLRQNSSLNNRGASSKSGEKDNVNPLKSLTDLKRRRYSNRDGRKLPSRSVKKDNDNSLKSLEDQQRRQNFSRNHTRVPPRSVEETTANFFRPKPYLPLKSQVCHKRFSHVSSPCQHVKEHNQDAQKPRKSAVRPKFVCQPSEKLQSVAQLEEYAKTDHQDGQLDFACHLCHQRFDAIATLEQHAVECLPNSAESRQKLVCKDSGAVFDKRKTLDWHVKEVHSKQDHPVIHDFCDQHLKNERGLWDHKRGVHSLDEEFRCRHCSASFNEGCQLEEHLRRRHNRSRCPTRYFDSKMSVTPSNVDSSSPSEAMFDNFLQGTPFSLFGTEYPAIPTERAFIKEPSSPPTFSTSPAPPPIVEETSVCLSMHKLVAMDLMDSPLLAGFVWEECNNDGTMTFTTRRPVSNERAGLLTLLEESGPDIPAIPAKWRAKNARNSRPFTQLASSDLDLFSALHPSEIRTLLDSTSKVRRHVQKHTNLNHSSGSQPTNELKIYDPSEDENRNPQNRTTKQRNDRPIIGFNLSLNVNREFEFAQNSMLETKFAKYGFDCGLCPGQRVFKSRHALRKHKDEDHSNIVYYFCQFCKRRFKRKVSLDTHLFAKH